MRASELDFHLPPELIAQHPAEPRDHSRLMHLDRASGKVRHLRFDGLPELLRPDDLLVLNDTRVLRARLWGYKVNAAADGKPENGARVEALLLREMETNKWECLLRPSARLKPGTPIRFASPDDQTAVMAYPQERTESGWIVRFETGANSDIREALPALGEVPLPPYISEKLQEESQYQTVYATGGKRDFSGETLESSAAPTAGLHFTPRVFDALAQRGIRTARVTLGIGIGTFRPIKTETIEEHTMHEEEYEISVEAAELINEQKRRGGRIVSVGTTSTRVLESAAIAPGVVAAGAGRTSIYIRPGHRFKIVDALITNFHLPRSSLLVMVSAFLEEANEKADSGLSSDYDEMAGLRKIRYAYNEAIQERYRFFSFGDAMLIE